MALCTNSDIEVKDAPPGELLSVEPPADPLTSTPAWESSETAPTPTPSWDVPDTEAAVPEPRESFPTVTKQRPKQYKRPTPSKFCHVCGRKTSTVPVAICKRIRDGLCRKVVCRCCFEKYGWEVGEMDTGEWVCTHCRGVCVGRAQCNIYGRTNYKRHLRLRRRRVGRELLRIAKEDPPESGKAECFLVFGNAKNSLDNVRCNTAMPPRLLVPPTSCITTGDKTAPPSSTTKPQLGGNQSTARFLRLPQLDAPQLTTGCVQRPPQPQKATVNNAPEAGNWCQTKTVFHHSTTPSANQAGAPTGAVFSSGYWIIAVFHANANNYQKNVPVRDAPNFYSRYFWIEQRVEAAITVASGAPIAAREGAWLFGYAFFFDHSMQGCISFCFVR